MIEQVAINSVAEVVDAVSTLERLCVVGGGSKPALSACGNGVTCLDVAGLTGILEYDPGEYTFTATAGTSLAEVEAALAAHDQYMPFDPPFVDQQATLGGTVAAGLSGSGRCRFGGVRDFLIGVQFVDGRGRMVRAGGKVVKNAAGFDLPKLMVGSLGCLGVLTELTFKVFPRPQAYATLRVNYATLAEAIGAMQRVTAEPVDFEALDIAVTPAGSTQLLVRVGGLPGLLDSRIAGLKAIVDAGEQLDCEEERAYWHSRRELSWAAGAEWLLKVPLAPTQMAALHAGLPKNAQQVHYVAGGCLAWVAGRGTIEAIDALLLDLGLSALVLRGNTASPIIGRDSSNEFYARVRQVLDPNRLFSSGRIA